MKRGSTIGSHNRFFTIQVPIGGVQNFPNNLTIISFLDLTARAAGLTPQPPPPQVKNKDRKKE